MGMEDTQEILKQTARSGLALQGKAITVLLAACSAIIAWGIHEVTSKISDINTEQRELNRQFTTFVMTNERRLTALEEYQKMQDQKAAIIEANIYRMQGQRK